MTTTPSKNNSYGLTTLKNHHVAVDESEVRFRFTGKSGKQWSLRVRDRRVAKIIRACQDLPGRELIQYLDRRCLPGCHLGGRKRLSQGNYRQGYHGKGLPHLGGNCSDGNDFLGAGGALTAQRIRQVIGGRGDGILAPFTHRITCEGQTMWG
jgi:hypothetical protein